MSARTILTLANGRGIDLRNPRPQDIDWPSMAEQLAKECRYNGATPGVFYSVAQHSVVGADNIFMLTSDRLLAALFLMHDGHEHALRDDTTPKKRAYAEEAEAMFGILAKDVMAAFDRVTVRHDVAIHEAAGLPWPHSPSHAAAIQRWDKIMFVTEWRDFMPGVVHPDWTPYAHIRPLPEPLKAVPWGEAKLMFLDRCREYLPVFEAVRHKPLLEIFPEKRVPR